MVPDKECTQPVHTWDMGAIRFFVYSEMGWCSTLKVPVQEKILLQSEHPSRLLSRTSKGPYVS